MGADTQIDQADVEIVVIQFTKAQFVILGPGQPEIIVVNVVEQVANDEVVVRIVIDQQYLDW